MHGRIGPPSQSSLRCNPKNPVSAGEREFLKHRDFSVSLGALQALEKHIEMFRKD